MCIAFGIISNQKVFVYRSGLVWANKGNSINLTGKVPLVDTDMVPGCPWIMDYTDIQVPDIK